MRERLIRFAAGLYPAPWRCRYGVEFDALLEDAGSNWRDIWNVLRGALKTQMTTWTLGKTAAVFGAAGALLCGALSFAMPGKYVSEAVLRFEASTRSREAPTNEKTEKALTGLIQTANSRDSLAGIIEKQGLYQRERARNGMDGAIETMRHDIRFDRVGQSNAFRVAFRYADATEVRRIDRELVNNIMAAAVARARSIDDGVTYNVEVLDPATLPKRASSPNRLVFMAVGLAAGLLIAAATRVRRATA